MIERVPANEPQNQNPLPPDYSEHNVWSPEFGAGQQPTAQTAGRAAVGENVEWDQPEKPVLREAGEFPKEEIEQVRGIYSLSRQAARSPEAAKAAGTLDPTAARRYLNDRLQAVGRGLGAERVSKRMAMVVGTMVAADPLEKSAEEADLAMKLIGSGAFPAKQLEVLMKVRDNMVRALAEGSADETAELQRIDELLYGTGVSGEGLLPQVGQPPRQGNENVAAFWLAYAAGLDTTNDGARRLRNLTNYMSTGRRGPNYVPLEQ